MSLTNKSCRSIRFRYSLRGLLVLLAVCGITIGLWKREASRHKRELRAVSEMRSFGVNVDFRQRAPAWLRRALGDQAMEVFETVEGISFPPDGIHVDAGNGAVGTLIGINDDDFASVRLSLQDLPNLASLGLSGTRVTDATLEHVEKLSTLRELDLSFTKVSEKRIEALCRNHPRLIVKK